MAAANDEIRLKTLNTSAKDEELERILYLARTVFEDNTTGTSVHTSLAGWRERLKDSRAQIVYAVKTTNPERPVGLFFSFPTTQPEVGFEALHIWLAAIDENARGLGIFPKLLEATIVHARGCGFDHLTVCTIPDRFKTMYRILQKTNWQFVAWREDSTSKKVLMKCPVD